ncbi:MAG: DUF72 domain-containing protein [Actinobacteria bacterium]|nr:DUF72 domain-containing protein [Actinomycetota bacterium]MDI6830810.1 DUF72 domain-containing protein [Actinomycetota bacterium]
MELKVGCCGFPQARQIYYETLPLVELQKTFYQLPRVKTAQKWRQESPPHFEFTLKAWQLITHRPSSPTYKRLTHPIPEESRDAYGSFKPTPENFAAWRETLEVATALDAEIVLFQTPATFTPGPKNIAQMREFLSTIERGRLQLAWEPRGQWDAEEAGRICRELDLLHVVDPFRGREKAGQIIYWRLHGIGSYRHRYTDQELGKLVTMLRRSKKKRAYVLFNNINMWEDAQRLLELWRRRS